MELELQIREFTFSTNFYSYFGEEDEYINITFHLLFSFSCRVFN